MHAILPIVRIGGQKLTSLLAMAFDSCLELGVCDLVIEYSAERDSAEIKGPMKRSFGIQNVGENVTITIADRYLASAESRNAFTLLVWLSIRGEIRFTVLFKLL